MIEELSESQQAAMIAHELVHLRRRDHWIRSFELLVVGLYWWYPLVWWIRREVERWQEVCCDVGVLELLPDKENYATTLLKAAWFLSTARSMVPQAANGIGSIDSFRRRIEMIVRTNMPAHLSWPMRIILVAIAVVVIPLSFTLTGTLRKSYAQGATPVEEESAARPAARNDIGDLGGYLAAAGGEVADTMQGSRAGDMREIGGLPLVWIPAGEFKMGSPSGHVSDREPPQVDVTISRGFWLGKTELTQGQWKALMGTEPWVDPVREEFYRRVSGTVRENQNHPAGYVSWVEANVFCRKLTDRERAAGRLPTSWEYRLPTEAEWEYACRAGTTMLFHFGSDPSELSEYAWWFGNTKDEPNTHAVATKKPNAWGLYDMPGSVFEWCLDCYDETLPGGTDPVVHTRSLLRIGRGGYWASNSDFMRSAYRSMRGLEREPGPFSGFRVALCFVVDAPLDRYLHQQRREAFEQQQSINNLKDIGLAMRFYHDFYRGFPAAYNTDQDGTALLSWRVHLLPFVQHERLYEQFHLDEPWDSEHNTKLIPQMPQVYRAPGSNTRPGNTNYLAIRGDDAVIVPPREGQEENKHPIGTRMLEIRGGTSNTIAIVETADERAVTWTKPEDLEPNEEDPLAGLIGLRPGLQPAFLALFCDGNVQVLPQNTSDRRLWSLFEKTNAGRSPKE